MGGLLRGVEAGAVDMGCVNACADYSIALGWCRGSFEFNRTSLPFNHASPKLLSLT